MHPWGTRDIIIQKVTGFAMLGGDVKIYLHDAGVGRVGNSQR